MTRIRLANKLLAPFVRLSLCKKGEDWGEGLPSSRITRPRGSDEANTSSQR
jgi:hypothetical protein